MLGQTFDLIDLPRLAALALIEVLLSADNAIVLAVLSHALPPLLRRRALYIGVISAFFLRAAAIFAVSFILDSTWLELLGAAYLIYLSIHHFFQKKQKSLPAAPSFWKTVLLIEFFDLAFALDSIIAGVAFIATPTPQNYSLFHPKLWIVYVGGMIGLLAIRSAADLFARLIDRLPRLETSAYLLVGWIGIKLAFEATLHLHGFEFLFWIGFALILASGFLRKRPLS